MGLAFGDVIALTIEGSIFSQRTLTTLHLRRLTAVNPALTITAELDDITLNASSAGGGADWIESEFLLACAQNWSMSFIHAQLVAPSRSVKRSRLRGLNGLVITDATAPNVAGVMTKRTVLAGRDQVGSIHMPGVPAAGYVDGMLEAVQEVRYEDLAIKLLTNLVATVTAAEYDLVIHHTAFPGTSSKVDTIVVQPELRVMRRRTVGLGI